ncbi:MAG: pitrilysin family protein [Vicinamibacterales bacterium]|jgi:zinc protease|nr:peptidase M16 [Acidobacteriota bacterium]MDP7294687.1 pitrilysin family protein [Vicinamibacterales bacterium]MDP7472333.1 pitrilysin family protein [Vicinamibacterales bacterium]MDP7672079.1 pitrilysin family protein [Vicinamibacterales bacterium]HJO39838.1 pitrilysin family protein [Vicinamibacterales bacterium]|tara:strand:+ start:694 stop:2004 length:1311 start_codon:yes stop_codon:yes gene_type:complete
MSSEGDAPAVPTVHSVVLDNGLTVLVQEQHAAPLASVWCWYRVGSKDEPPGSTGISHWVEHMNFKGTTNIPKEQIKGIIERYGGSWNGYTWIDQTAYMETAASHALDHMLFIESERMSNGLYEAAECESERTVIISELQGGENDPEQLLDIEVTATAFKAHPYRHPTIGWVGDLQRMSRDDLYAYYRRFYAPNNATLVIVGDVDTDEVIRLAERRFGAIPSVAAGDRVRTQEPVQTGERRLTVMREGATAYWKAAYHAPAVGDADFAPMLLLDAVLTGAKGVNLWSSFQGQTPQRTARLYRALVDGGLASGVDGALLPTEDPYLFAVSAEATAGTALTSLEAAALDVLDRVRLEGITQPELERAKRQFRARLVFENDSVTNIAHQLGYFATVASLDLFCALPDRIEAVTLEQVGDAARRHLAPSNRTIGWFQPLAA